MIDLTKEKEKASENSRLGDGSGKRADHKVTKMTNSLCVLVTTKDNAFKSMTWHGMAWQWAMADERGRDKETHAAWCRKWRFLGGVDLEARAVSAVTSTSTPVI